MHSYRMIALVLGTLLLPGQTLPTRAIVPAENLAILLGWGGAVDTDLKFSEFFERSHTITVRFMPRYPYAYAGPILAANGSGAYLVGQGDYHWGSQTGRPVLFMNIAGRRVVYEVPERDARMFSSRWNHLAVVRADNLFKLYLNGNQLTPDLTPIGRDLPSGDSLLRLGRPTAGQAIDREGHEGQFYGLIDDVAVYQRALSESEIKSAASVMRLSGFERDLYAGWTFDRPRPEEPSLPPALSRTFIEVRPSSPSPSINDRHAAYQVRVSPQRKIDYDIEVLNLPNPNFPKQHPMRLPFREGQAWAVIQGYDDPSGSHRGYAAFCWDFMLAGAPQAETKGLPFYASAPGTVTYVKQDVPADSAPPNIIMIKQAEGEFAGYLHLLSNTVRVAENSAIQAGQELAKTGDSGVRAGSHHLHFAVSNLPDTPQDHRALVTIPVVFSDYEVSDDQGRSWRHVEFGEPRKGQWVKAKRKK